MENEGQTRETQSGETKELMEEVTIKCAGALTRNV